MASVTIIALTPVGIAAAEGATSAACQQGPAPRIGGTYMLEPVAFRGQFLRHRNSLGEISPLRTPLDTQDATFTVVKGLAGRGISLRAVNIPNAYLRHQDFRMKLAARESRRLFNEDATFSAVQGLSDCSAWSLRSVNYPDRYVRHYRSQVFVTTPSHFREIPAATAKKDATWRLVPAESFCPSVMVVGARGSGDPPGLGRIPQAVVNDIRAQRPNASVVPLDYPARGMASARDLTEYKGSVQEGERRLKKLVEQQVAGPCGQRTGLYLLGYSQGAHVVGNVLEPGRLSAAARGRIQGVALIADPRFRGSQPTVNVGDFDHRLNGIWSGWPLQARNVPVDMHARLRSYCLPGDFICNYTSAAAAQCLRSPNDCAHGRYDSRRYAATGRTYTTEAAAFLLSRMR